MVGETMAFKAIQIPIPSDGSVVDVGFGAAVAARNTGAVKLLLGGADGVCVFPLGPNATDNDLGEFVAVDLSRGGDLRAKVKTPGAAGQITAFVETD